MAAVPANDRAEFIKEQVQRAGVAPPTEVLEVEKKVNLSEMRRRSRFPVVDPVTSFSMVEQDDVVRLTTGIVAAPVAAAPRAGRGARRARAGGVDTPSGNVLYQGKFADLEPNKIQQYLAGIDGNINAANGLRQWNGQYVPPDETRVKDKGRILLIIHGFISKTDHLIQEMQSIEEGRDFLGKAQTKYDQILTFDHATISVGPLLNAIDLHQRMSQTKADLDIICHSRGGLVTRWWLELLRDPELTKQPPRVIFLGSPLSGTSLAAPPRVKQAIDLLSSIGNALAKISEYASVAAPYLFVATALFKVLSSVTKILAKTPLIDAGINIASGVSGMSAVGNNPDITRLRGILGAQSPNYFAVKSNFEPEAVGWRFSRTFRNPGDRLKNLVLDQVFPGQNDLIVDCDYMTNLTDNSLIQDEAALRRVLDYKTNPDVHHNNYFRQPDTINFFREVLKI